MAFNIIQIHSIFLLDHDYVAHHHDLMVPTIPFVVTLDQATADIIPPPTHTITPRNAQFKSSP